MCPECCTPARNNKFLDSRAAGTPLKKNKSVINYKKKKLLKFMLLFRTNYLSIIVNEILRFCACPQSTSKFIAK